MLTGAHRTAPSSPFDLSTGELIGTFSQTTMVDFHVATEYNLHLNLHPMVGGAWGCAVDLADAVARVPDATTALGELSLLYDTILHMGYFFGDFNCPNACGDDVAFAHCTCTCDDVNGTELTSWVETLTASVGTNTSYLADDDAFTDAAGAANGTATGAGGAAGGLDASELDRIYALFERHVVRPLLRYDAAHAGASVTARVFSFDEGASRWVFRDAAGGDRAAAAGASASSDDDAAIASEIQQLLSAVSVTMACIPGKLSQFMSPLGSANDPIFWPLHMNWEKNW